MPAVRPVPSSPVRHAVVADLLQPSAPQHAALSRAALVLCGVLLLSACARVEIRVPFSIVPVTGQTFGVLLLAALLGARQASATVLAYLVAGAAGAPVFAGGGGGVAWLLGPTGGYLAGFLPAAFVTGWLADRGWDRRFGTALVAMVTGNLIIYACGLPWLALYLSADQVLAHGLYPFLPGAAMKVTVASLLLPVGWRVLSLGGFDTIRPAPRSA
ncbi:MAG: biotin transporter BioY [Phycisphaeraceae bacterium]|nr:biotin transporter BioY [Phycisphaeraceae bacterium]